MRAAEPAIGVTGRAQADERECDDVHDTWMAAMRRGDFEAAWRQTDRIEIPRRRAEALGSFSWQPRHLLWNGSPVENREVLVRCNHGLGDTIQFVRYVPLLRQRAGSVTLFVQPPLLPLFAGVRAFGDVRNGWTPDTPPHDVEIEIMELPYVFRSTIRTLPRRVPYIPLSPLRAAGNALPLLGPSDGLRVGLLWTASDWDPERSIPLSVLEPLGRIRGVGYVSLQQGDAAAEVRDAPFPIEPYSEHTAEITAVAAAIRKLDLVITVDSMLAHLAGALARPVWVLLQHEADWRWMTARSDSPWYPTMRLFRQPRGGDWTALAWSVARALAEATRARSVG
jgi:hypothetical protein